MSESEVVFIGDSIIKGMLNTTLWNEKISALHCVNFGIGGDRTQHVLWRLLNGEMDFNTKLKAVVLFVGTNNVKDESEDVVKGILECVKIIRTKHSNAHVILPVSTVMIISCVINNVNGFFLRQDAPAAGPAPEQAAGEERQG